jgi:hypothetical protein
MKQKFVFAIVISIGLAVLTLSAIAQAPERVPPLPGQPIGPGIGAAGRPGASRDILLWGPVIQGEDTEQARQTEALVRQLGEAKDDAERDKLKTRLTEVLEKQFDFRQKRHTTQIEQLEKTIKKLKELVQKRQDNRRDIISKRLDQLEREARGLGW